jgi:membrane protease YdiL (CAAX protease family)
MPPSLKRIMQFVRSVLPADPAQLLFLCGCILLFISFWLRWWPAEVSGSVRHIGPFTVHQSDASILRDANAWIPFYWWCSVTLSACGAGGLFLSLWPGSRPLRCVFLFVWMPCFLALTAICGRWLYLAKDPLFPLLEHSLPIRPHSPYWAVWQLGPGLHVSLLGLIFVSLFLSRMAFGLTSLPVSLAEPRVQNADQADGWDRIWLFILLACTCLFLANIIGGLPLLGFSLLFPNAVALNANGNVTSPAGWIIYFLAPLPIALVAAVAAWAVGRDRWKELRQFLQVPTTKYVTLAMLFPVTLRTFFLFIVYAQKRISWTAFQFGKFDAPSLQSYFAIPRISAFADYMPNAFFEEVIWRGYLQPRFVSRYGLYRGLFLVSLLWAAFHFQGDFNSHSTDSAVLLQILWRVAGCLALGFVLGWLTLRSGSIWPAAIAHGLYNVSLQVGQGGYPIFSKVLNLALWVGLAWLLFRFWPPEPAEEISDGNVQLVPELPAQP